LRRPTTLPAPATTIKPGGKGDLLSLASGLVPCAGSVLILLYACANDILWTGLTRGAAIAVGMVLTMGSLGLASSGTWTLVAAAIASAALITGLGLFPFATSF
jgi:nickel/cobalt transporter (NicO) family protein